MTKLWKSKIWINSFVAFSVDYVMVYIVFSGVLSLWRNLRNKNAYFEIFQKITITPTLWCKLHPLECISKISISFCPVAIFVGYVVAYFNFSVGAVIVEQLAKQNWLFSKFLPKIIRENLFGEDKFSVKNWKQTILFCKLLHKDSGYRKIEVYHDVANGKCYEIETKRNFWNAF